MPVHKIESTATHVRLWKDSNVANRTDIDIIAELITQGGPGNEIKVAAVIQSLLQASLDVRQIRNQLPQDDPDRNTNPNRPDLFWEQNELVGRSVEVYNVTWDGTVYVVSLRRVG